MLYEMWLTRHNALTEQAFARLSEQEKQDIQGKLIEAHNAANATVLVMCDSGWANEEYDHWGITIFPSLEARTMLYNKMGEAGMFRFIQSVSLLGTTMQEPKLPTYEHPVYVLSRLRHDATATSAFRSLPNEAMMQLSIDEHASFEKNGGCRLIQCNPYWANDAYLGFEANAFPSLEAVQNYKADIFHLDWPLYHPSDSILGLPGTM